jgi:hypothetical protein
MQRYDEDFVSLLEGFNLETLERDSSIIYGLSSNLTLNYFNPSWFRFAAENGGEPAISGKYKLGTCIDTAMVGPAKDYYLKVYQSILRTGKVWHHDYECSTSEKYRRFHQSVHPLYNGSGLIVVNSLIAEYPHEEARRPCPPSVELYVNDSGLIMQCCNCRRVQRATKDSEWNWVPAWVDKMPDNISHGICPICCDYYYKYKILHDS